MKTEFVLKPNAEFYSIWSCPHCEIVFSREAIPGVRSQPCENCDEDGTHMMEAYVMTSDYEEKEVPSDEGEHD